MANSFQYINGDCLKEMKAIPDSSIHLIITDPPYGINYKSNKQNCDTRGTITVNKHSTDYFDKIDGDDKLSIDWLIDAFRVLKNNSAIYIFSHWKTWGALQAAVENAGFKVKNMIVLNKSNHGMGDLKGSFASKHELLMFAAKGRHYLNFPNGRKNDVWNVPVKFSGAKRLHPNEKPISWITPCIENSSKQGDLVLDPFAGSFTVAEACKKLNRKCISIEKDLKYFNVGVNRINNI